MQYTSPVSYPNHASPRSVIPQNTPWLSALLPLAPWSPDDTSLVQETIPRFGSVHAAESNYSTELLHLAGHRHDADRFDPPCDFYPHIYPNMHTSCFAEADQSFKPIAIEDHHHDSVESPHILSLPSDHLETAQESTTGDSPGPDERGYEIILQDTYQKGRRVTHIIPPIQYYGFSLNSAYKREYHDLADVDSSAWPAVVPVAEKLAIVFCFPGKPRYHRQVHIRRTDSRVLTRGKLATIVAREVQTFLGKIRVGNQEPFKHCGADIALEDLVLVDVQHVSKGSLQPTIGVITKRST